MEGRRKCHKVLTLVNIEQRKYEHRDVFLNSQYKLLTWMFSSTAILLCIDVLTTQMQLFLYVPLPSDTVYW